MQIYILYMGMFATWLNVCKSQSLHWVSSSITLHIYCLRQNLLLNLELDLWARIAGRWVPGTCLSLPTPTDAGITNPCCHTWIIVARGTPISLFFYLLSSCLEPQVSSTWLKVRGSKNFCHSNRTVGRSLDHQSGVGERIQTKITQPTMCFWIKVS